MPTIKDVARACGVSPATVSYVLNNGPRTVHPKTRERVLHAIHQLDYYPSAVARGLHRKRMNALGVVFPHTIASPLTNPYFAPILDGILEVAMQRHQNITLFTGHIWSDARHSLAIYCDGRCDGLLLIAPSLDSDIVPALSRKEIPFVLISDSSDDPAVSGIDIDNVTASAALVGHLLEQGHRRIGIFCGNPGARSTAQRLCGYRQALEACNVPFDESLVFPGHYIEDSGYERALALAQRPADQQPTALFCGSDQIALGALRAFAEQDLPVPEAISVVGFDDIPAAAATRPPLTTVRQPLHLLGERAAKMLLDHIHTDQPCGQQVVLPAELILRGSVAPPPARN